MDNLLFQKILSQRCFIITWHHWNIRENLNTPLEGHHYDSTNIATHKAFKSSDVLKLQLSCCLPYKFGFFP